MPGDFISLMSAGFLWLSVVFGAGCTSPEDPAPIDFTSSDPTLVERWQWAKNRALSYAHDGKDDPVGPWYEAALPGRDAFCARDFSHQSIGAHLLSLADHNWNMLSKFAANISKEKDWATWWEIDRLDRPAPVDYRSDSEFWYNLPANFDLVLAAWRLYRWTGDARYLTDSTLDRFYVRSTREYVARWALDPDSLRTRRRFMNRESFDLDDPYQASRGIPTYNEEDPGATRVGVDLPALQAAAYRAYAGMLRARVSAGRLADTDEDPETADSLAHVNGPPRDGADSLVRAADSLLVAADRVTAALDSIFWDAPNGRYNDLLRTDGTVIRGGSMQSFVPYAAMAVSPERTAAAARSSFDDSGGNVEMRSYLPGIGFDFGLSLEAHDEMISLTDPGTERRDYPEVSFAMIEAFVRGLMGVEPAESSPGSFGAVRTRSRLPDSVTEATVRSVPVGTRRVDVSHQGRIRTSLTNHGTTPLTWVARFDGLHTSLLVDGNPTPAAMDPDAVDGAYSAVRVTVAAGKTTVVSVVGF